MSDLERELARQSAREMVASLGLQRAPELVQRGLALPFEAMSRQLAKTLARLDLDIPELGLPRAAGRALERFGVTLEVSGAAAAPSGPCLVLANHPGAYDALALMAALARPDLLILAADRGFLRALGGLSQHMLFVGESAAARAGALKRSLRWLRRGGALLHFPAGRIEPDADFEPRRGHWLEPWQPGASALLEACARADGRVLLAGVRGVHSPRAKRQLLNRVAESRGVTTLSLLLQLARRLRDVQARVHLSLGPELASLLELDIAGREQALRLALTSAIAGPDAG